MQAVERCYSVELWKVLANESLQVGPLACGKLERCHCVPTMTRMLGPLGIGDGTGRRVGEIGPLVLGNLRRCNAWGILV
jgi:hypothetical protein